MRSIIYFYLLMGMAISASASAATKTYDHFGTRSQRQAASVWNRMHSVLQPRVSNVLRPFSEMENTGYVVINGQDAFELADLRLAIAQNLPANVTLVVAVADSTEAGGIRSRLGSYLGDRLKFLVVDESNGDPVWSRDSMPFPVYLNATTIGLVDSLYYQDFEPDLAVAKAFGLAMTSTGIYFRGGNLLFDFKGNCFAEVAREVADMQDPTGFFTKYFGCSSVTLLNHEGGIGDIDERVKFLGGTDVLTDNDNYAKIFAGKGYVVHKIPTTGANYETYMNTLFVNGTIFVPQMGISADKDAIAAYEALGFKAVGVNTRSMADDGHGNIHCVTMNYPPGSFVASPEGGAFVQFVSRER